MTWDWTYWIENTGGTTGTIQMALDPTQSYVIEGFITLKDGGDYAHVFISELCTQVSADQIDCGVNDEGSASIVAAVSNATSVTVGLRTTGGHAKAEGVIWQL